MEFDIIEAPIRFQLCGLASSVRNNNFGEVGMSLMNEMWKVMKASKTATTGINHWVYLPDNQMFVGVELVEDSQCPAPLDAVVFELQRYLKHVHIGPYQALPAKWSSLKSELARRGESIYSPSLEIYGHHNDDPSKLETTILMGLMS